MNSLLIAGIGLVAYIIAYHFYGGFLNKVWEVNPERKTPAFEKQDGVDYIPAKHWIILFGHHFASIAGAGPIIGPVIAAVIWGWGPAALWIILGSIFLGGVHDFSALMVSLRNEGKSVGDVSAKVVSETSKIVFLIFLWFTLVLVVAVFAAVTAKTFVEQPDIVVPTFSLILIAVLFGYLVYKRNLPLFPVTILSIILYIILFLAGTKLPVVIKIGNPLKVWILILLIYSFVASVIPVNLLLQPRDYLSSFILFFGLFFGYIGLLISHPVIKTPAFITFNSTKGTLWPMMFVIIACGAISGFHSLVSSGTSSKQLSNEKYARNIGYGGMLTEGTLSILALLCVTAGLYWKGGGELNYPELMKTGNWIGTFAKGYGQITSKIFTSTGGTMIAIVMINSFVLTTLDTATRITRYISQELFGETWKIKIFKNRFFTTLFIILFAGYLAFGNWKKIWPVFGASNQLVSSIVLLVVGCYLMIKGKNYFITLIPSLIMFATTITALIYKGIIFYKNKEFLLGNISAILTILGISVLIEGIGKMKKLKGVKMKRFKKEFLDDEDIRKLEELSKICKGDILTMTTLAGSGHPGGSMSSLDIYLTVFSYANISPSMVDAPERDKIIVSHGHTSPAVYSVLGRLGFFDIEMAIATFRLSGTIFEGHIVRKVPGVEWGTGNLGQGLSAGCGFALADKIHKRDSYTFVLMSDGEQTKGQVGEARRFAVKYGLNNITVVIDYNKIQISGCTDEVMPCRICENYKADGWEVMEVDGHDFRQLYEAIRKSITIDKPVCILARTVMGKGVSFMEGQYKYHGKIFPEIPLQIHQFLQMRQGHSQRQLLDILNFLCLLLLCQAKPLQRHFYYLSFYLFHILLESLYL